LYRNLLVSELAGDDMLFIGQAAPRAWLEDGQRVIAEWAPTYFGPVNFRIESAAAARRISATLRFLGERRPQRQLARFRHPEKQRLRWVTVNGAGWEDLDPEKEWVRIPHPTAAHHEVIGHY
jgi:hypothetical protein